MKKILSVCLLLALLLSFSGCNNETLTSVYGKTDYTVSLDTLKSSYSTVVAELGDQKIDLELLQVAYWMEFVNFLYRNSNNLAPFNLDISLPLHQQTIPGSTNNWQQHFLDEALKTLHNHLAMVHAAQLEGVTMPDGIMTAVEADIAEMEKVAKEDGYTDMDAYVTYMYGPGCTLKGLKAYNYLSRCADYYKSVYLSKQEVTDQMVVDYYEAHKEDFINAGMIDDGTFVYEVRHMMVIVDEGSDDSVWEEARVKAQGWLDTYLAGEQTEEAFAALALEYSDDNETYLAGGKISGLVELSTYPTDFKNWYLDESRQTGDVELVKTELGYHVMYYIGTLPTWKYHAGQSLTNTIINAVVPDTVAKYPITIYFDKLNVCEAATEQ